MESPVFIQPHRIIKSHINPNPLAWSVKGKACLLVTLGKDRDTEGFPGSWAGEESACHVGDLGLIPGLGRSLREENSYPLLHSGLENSMDCITHGVAKRQTWLSNSHFYGRNTEHEDILPSWDQLDLEQGQ